MNHRFIALYIPVQSPQVLRRIAVWCGRFTPFVCVEQDLTAEILHSQKLRRGLVLDITGTSRIHKSEESLGKKILDELHARHIPASVAFASTVGAAWALSRFSHKPLVIHSAEPLKTFLSSLPLEALRINEDTVLSLHEVGVFSLGELFSLPIKELAVRFGLPLLRRVDQILGRSDEPLRIVRVAEHLTSDMRLEHPLFEVSKVKRVVLHLLDDLLQKLQQKSSKASAFHMQFRTEGGGIITRNVSLYLASRNLRHLSSIIQPTIESLTIQEPIQQVSISALQVRPTEKEQGIINGEESSFVISDDKRAFGELVDVLSSKLGGTALKRAVLRESYIPERSYELIPFHSQKEPFVATSISARSTPFVGARPSYLFKAPHPIQVIAMLPDKPPSWIHWNGEKLKLLKGIGPERISHEWWYDGLASADAARDYFTVQDEKGRWLWVFRDTRHLQWFIHGIWA